MRRGQKNQHNVAGHKSGWLTSISSKHGSRSLSGQSRFDSFPAALDSIWWGKVRCAKKTARGSTTPGWNKIIRKRMTVGQRHSLYGCPEGGRRREFSRESCERHDLWVGKKKERPKKVSSGWRIKLETRTTGRTMETVRHGQLALITAKVSTNWNRWDGSCRKVFCWLCWPRRMT